MTVAIPHPKLMKRLILCSNPSSPWLLGTQEIPRLQVIGRPTSCTSLLCMERTRICRSGCARYAGESWLNTPIIALLIVISEKYGFSKVPEGVANYVYGMSTGYLNLRKHLASKHAAAYDKAIVENNWNYRFSTDVKSGKTNTIETRKQSLPPFTQTSFIDYIIRFVVADDQVSNAFSVTNLCPHPYLVNSCCRVSRVS